ncbi:tripartite motif-containing protein 3-like [Mercenaria mercenaria]|uniref:tripartite motif-containing protein 3-like n=1 Tax=Mercenaria mercenaria TaxID=6596 RepID=UPI00234F7E92|nr:tripartite motif-containing protein 3-like [Mercenaria mercenaria]
MAKRLVNNLKDEYLSCSICLDQYRQPKTLPCDHIFCQECLSSHVVQNIHTHKTHVEISCPLCRKKTSIKSKGNFDVEAWVNTLPTDSLVGSLMQTLNMHERGTRSPEVLPKLCESHGGKPCDAYCFTHAQLMCWECAARDHRICSVDSADKAKHLVQPEIESMKKTVENHLARARELSKSDETFKNSKVKVLNDLQDFERRLDKVYTSAKHQLCLLKSEVEKVTKMHLDERKNFYDAVQSLLELKCSIEIMANESEATKLFALLKK